MNTNSATTACTHTSPATQKTRDLVIHFRGLPLWLITVLEVSGLLRRVKDVARHTALRQKTKSTEVIKGVTMIDPGEWLTAWLGPWLCGEPSLTWGVSHAHILITPNIIRPNGPIFPEDLEGCVKQGHAVSLIVAMTDQTGRMAVVDADRTVYENTVEAGVERQLMTRISRDDIEVLAHLLMPQGPLTFKYLNYWRQEDDSVDNAIIFTELREGESPTCYLHKVLAKRGFTSPADLI